VLSTNLEEMKTQDNINFDRIAEAIDYIQNNFRSQPDLDEVAEKVHLSPYHFQRMFTEWAGTSPKKFLQYISVEHAKKMLKENQASLFDTAIETGLSGTSRLHDLFMKIEGMTPGEYKNGGAYLTINYSLQKARLEIYLWLQPQKVFVILHLLTMKQKPYKTCKAISQC